MAKKETKVVSISAGEVPEMAGAADFLDTLDQKRIAELETRIAELKDRNASKVYAVNLGNADVLESVIDFMENKAEWTNTEALGIIEVCKVLKTVKKEGVKEGMVYMESLPLQAAHYFLSKSKGTGKKSATDFITMFKPFGIALENTKADANEVVALEKELAAAQQGLSVA